MNYYYTNILNNVSFNDAIEKVTLELKKEGFGVLTQIDIKETLKKKLDVDFYNYIILGACNPNFAYKALCAEDKIGAMLPCNIIVQEREKETVEVSAVNPIASMQAIKNSSLINIASDVNEKLKRVIKNLKSF